MHPLSGGDFRKERAGTFAAFALPENSKNLRHCVTFVTPCGAYCEFVHQGCRRCRRLSRSRAEEGAPTPASSAQPINKRAASAMPELQRSQLSTLCAGRPRRRKGRLLLQVVPFMRFKSLFFAFAKLNPNPPAPVISLR